MHTIVIIIHVMSMIASVALMSSALILGSLGKNSAAHVATVGMVLTVLGAVTGSILLFFAPLLSECIILTLYVSGATALYTFGFGSGYAERARLIRHSAE